MFAAARDPLLAHRIIKRAGVADNLLDCFTIATATQRIVGVVVERNVQHRTKIEIETKNAEQASGDVAVLPDKIDIIVVAQLLRVRRLVTDQTQSGNAPAFLVDRDNRFNRAQFAKVVNQFAQLRRAFDVASEQNESTRLHFSKQLRRLDVEFFSRHSGEDQLTK